MKISVLVTTHNRPDYLRKALASYLDQTRLPDELIIADDGSGSDTRAVVDAFADEAPFRVVHAWQPHTGIPRLSHLRNLGTRSITGDYIIYTDGDCIASRHFVADHERLARPGWFVQGKRAWVKYKALDEFTGRESLLKKLWLCATGGLTKPHWLLHLSGMGLTNKTIEHIQSCNLAVFREDVIRINGWNEQFLGFWMQDSEFALRLIRSGVQRCDALFCAMVYHLEHEKPRSETDLKRNQALLENAHTSAVFEQHGLYPDAVVGNKAA
ncbi:MAG: glycosyltransferase [Planctomycetaceae bacterium]|nr:glycosyltransferase [Planctomycetaceae bacterium]